MPIAYKILVDGKSCHGGMFEWSLPTADGPGEWHELPQFENGGERPLIICNVGFHLTKEPAQWWKTKSLVFEAEYEGDVAVEHASLSQSRDKFAVRRVRLLRQVPWETFGVYTTGKHTITGQTSIIAGGDAEITALKHAIVFAHDTVKVLASGRAQVHAYNNSRVVSHGRSQVYAFDAACVDAFDASMVECNGRSKITAHDHSIVRIESLNYGSNNPTVHGLHCSTILFATINPTHIPIHLTLVDRAVYIARPYSNYSQGIPDHTVTAPFTNIL